MKRKVGARVVRSEGEDVLLDSTGSHNLTAPDVTPAPSLDIFSKFQSHRADFDAHWILAEEDDGGSSAAASPIHAEVSAKLQQRKTQLDAVRRAKQQQNLIRNQGGVDTTANTTAASDACSEVETKMLHERLVETTTDGARMTALRASLRDETELAMAGAPLCANASAARRKRIRQGELAQSASSDDEEDAYVPECAPTMQNSSRAQHERHDTSRPDLRQTSRRCVNEESRRSSSSEDEDNMYVPRSLHATSHRVREEDAANGSTATRTNSETAQAKDAVACDLKHRSAVDSIGSDDSNNNDDEGLCGDYLLFLGKGGHAQQMQSHSPESTGECIAESDLQAIVTVPDATQNGESDGPGRAKSRTSFTTTSVAVTACTHPNEAGSAHAATVGCCPMSEAAPGTAVVVPLWSVERVRRYGGYCRSNARVALHQEVTDLCDYLSPTEAEVAVRRYLELEVVRLARQLWSDCEAVVYGSLRTHLLLPSSDVDITLTSVPVSVEEALTALAERIASHRLCEDAAYPQVILKTKVPLIKFTHRQSRIDVDISIDATDGKDNSQEVISLLNDFPEARALTMVVKYFLQQRDMHEPYRGGLGSYATTLLMVSFLQHHPTYTTRPEQRAYTGLGQLLVDFFRYYGQAWNYARVGISVEKGGCHFIRADVANNNSSNNNSGSGGGGNNFAELTMSPTSPRSPFANGLPSQAIVEDPARPSNNAASSLRNFHAIYAAFTYAYQALTADFDSEYAKRADQKEDKRTQLYEQQQQQKFGASSSGVKTRNTSSSSSALHAANAVVYCPAAPNIAHRPTLLSRILHVDADMLMRRRAMAATYEQLCNEEPAAMAKVKHYRRDEDAAMWMTEETEGGRTHRIREVRVQKRDVARERRTLNSVIAARKGLDERQGRGGRGSSSNSDAVETSGSEESNSDRSNASSVRK